MGPSTLFDYFSVDPQHFEAWGEEPPNEPLGAFRLVWRKPPYLLKRGCQKRQNEPLNAFRLILRQLIVNVADGEALSGMLVKAQLMALVLIGKLVKTKFAKHIFTLCFSYTYSWQHKVIGLYQIILLQLLRFLAT